MQCLFLKFNDLAWPDPNQPKVQWTDNAVAHPVNIYEYIALNSPTNAKQMVNKITNRSVQIAAHPHWIIYRIKQDQIDVLAVIHGARLLPDEI